MIETVVRNYLNSTLPVPAYMEKPEREPGRYVLIEKTGSGLKNHIQSATLAIQSHAESLYEAANLNEKVKNAMNNIVILDFIGSSDLNSDYNFTDTTKKKYRYQAIYDLTY